MPHPCPTAMLLPTQLRVPGAALVTDGGLQALAGLTGLQDLNLSCLRVRAGVFWSRG